MKIDPRIFQNVLSVRRAAWNWEIRRNNPGVSPDDVAPRSDISECQWLSSSMDNAPEPSGNYQIQRNFSGEGIISPSNGIIR